MLTNWKKLWGKKMNTYFIEFIHAAVYVPTVFSPVTIKGSVLHFFRDLCCLQEKMATSLLPAIHHC